jgi:hypothetical protein
MPDWGFWHAAWIGFQLAPFPRFVVKAATQMNATSSRAHTVVTLIYTQIITTEGAKTTRSSEINLVDLAGGFLPASQPTNPSAM